VAIAKGSPPPPFDIDRLRAANPIEPGEPGYFEVSETIFKDHNPEFGSSFMYDSIVATGMGLCLSQNETNATIDSQVEGIRSVDFVGASGNIRFCQEDCAINHSTRDPSSAYWALFNFGAEGNFSFTDMYTEDTGFVHLLDDFSETNWIFIMIIVQVEVIIFAIPTVAVLQGTHATDGNYIGYVILLWTFPMSTLCFIFIPKMVAHYRSRRGVDITRPQSHRGDGGRGVVKITGLATAEERSTANPCSSDGDRGTPSLLQEQSAHVAHAGEP